MAWSSAALTSDEIARAAADKPIVVAANALDTRTGTTPIRWTIGGAGTDADQVNTSYPAAALYDGLLTVNTEPQSSRTLWYLNLTLDGTQDIDCCVIIGHNFGTNGATVQLQIADDAAHSTNAQTIATWTPSAPASGKDDLRLASLSLKHTGSAALRYSSVSHVRLRISTSGSTIPKIRELWLGRRRQLPRHPSLPWDEDRFQQRSARFETDGGSIIDRVYWKGRRALSPSILVSSTADQSELLSFFAESEHGTRSMLWFDEPGTNAAHVLMVKNASPEAFALPQTGFSQWSWSPSFVEQGGAYYADEG